MTSLTKQTLLWQNTAWPYFHWDSTLILDSLVKLKQQQGRLLALEQFVRNKNNFHTSETIEQDILKISNMALTKEKIFSWHAGLFPNGYSGLNKLLFNEFRKQDICYDQTTFFIIPAERLQNEVKNFLNWLSDPPYGLDGLVRAGLSHLWFSIISPFEDGNQSLAFYITDLVLQQDEKSSVRIYQTLEILNKNKNSYENILKNTLFQNGDITTWLIWFFENLENLMKNAELNLIIEKNKILFKAKIFNFEINQRQKNIILSLLETPNAEISNKSCVEICRPSSRESIKRDLSDLVKKKLLIKKNQGRSVSYQLNFF